VLAKLEHQFSKRVHQLAQCCTRAEKALTMRALRPADVYKVHGSCFVSICASWEAYLIDVLGTCACTKKGRRLAIVRPKSRNVFNSILLFPGRNYPPIANLSAATDAAKVFLHPEGRPFSVISEVNQTFLTQAQLIRNAIAHGSTFALEQFRKKVSGVDSLPPRKQSPEHYLNHTFRKNPSQRRWEIYFHAFRLSAAEITRGW